MYAQYMVKYKGHMLWSNLTYIYTDNEAIARELGMKPYSAQCPNVYELEISPNAREELYEVNRHITYRGLRFDVDIYGFESNAYLLLSSDMSLMETMGFEWIDNGLCEKWVPVSETTDPVDEYKRLM